MVMRLRLFAAAAVLALDCSTATAAPILAPPQPPGAELQQYVKVQPGRIALSHVRVIDGTGAAPVEDQTLLIDGPRIAAVQPASAAVPPGYSVLDLNGATVLPGL